MLLSRHFSSCTTRVSPCAASRAQAKEFAPSKEVKAIKKSKKRSHLSRYATCSIKVEYPEKYLDRRVIRLLKGLLNRNREKRYNVAKAKTQKARSLIGTESGMLFL